MAGRFPSSHGILAALVLFLAAAEPGVTSAEDADGGQGVIRLVAAAADEPARMIAIGISTLANLHVEAADIEINWVVRQDRAVEGALDETSAMALLDLGTADLGALDSGLDLRAVMAFWHAGRRTEIPAISWWRAPRSAPRSCATCWRRCAPTR
ncbi:MAG: hypothetical protein HC871_11920 [Rhizobiales bacterium]|nr:hypothetical protein [Hyphomicrobiales bacterium]